MKKMKNSKGFTLMEMLIVVAIIAVLIAIAVPTFTKQLERAKEATDAANIRVAYAEAAVDALTKANGTGSKESAPMTQAVSGWENTDLAATKIGDKALSTVTPVKGEIIVVTVNADGTVGLAKK